MKIYRARGIYRGSQKEEYLTTVWRRNREEAEEDIQMLATSYTKAHVVSKEWETEKNVSR